MGLLTVDVSPFGVVMTSDSQPVDLFAGHVAIHGGNKARSENHLVPFTLPTFAGVAGYVGTEEIEGVPTRQWLQGEIKLNAHSTLPELCSALADALTARWQHGSATTHLSLFIAGYEGQEARFWWVSNGDVPDAGTVSIPVEFVAVNDLDEHYIPQRREHGEGREATIARLLPAFRRGVLAAANIFDLFTGVVVETMRQGHPQIPPIDSLERYAAYVKFRFEFTKRMYDSKYGVGTDPVAPVGGEIHVVSVDPSGVIRVHGKHLGQSRVFRST